MTREQLKAKFPYASEAFLDANATVTNYQVWTEREILILKSVYSDPNAVVDIALLAKSLGRTHASVALKASGLKLTNFSRRRSPEAIEKSAATRKKAWASMTKEERTQRTSHLIKDGSYWKGKQHSNSTKQLSAQRSKTWHEEHEHHRGMAGKTHSDATRAKLSAALTGRKIPREQVERMLRTRLAIRNTPGFNPRPKATWHCGWLTVGGKKHYYRSSWEARYAQMLELLKRGKVIREWEYEPKTFWFPVPKGKNNYTPDFRLTFTNGKIEFHEVKGWMDKRSRTVISRMRRFYPEVTLIIRDASFFKCNRLGSSVPIQWEQK